MKRILVIIGCILWVCLGASATVKPRIRKAGVSSANIYRAPWNTPSRRAGSQYDAPLRSLGVQRVPVVLVDFVDKHFMVAEGDEAIRHFYDLFCNGTRDGNLYKGAGSYGAVRDYFVQQSDSLFLPEFEVIGPVTLDKSYAYYGRNKGDTHDINVNAFVVEAVTGAQTMTDWSTFDNDADGMVDMIYFIYAGEGENGCDDENTIWPHEYTNPRTIAGVKFGSYSCCNEVYDGKADGVGVMCHELMHALGMPDIYDTSGSGNYGMDYWDIMDTGCYCQGSYHPCGLSAYEKDFMGWRSLTTLERDQIAHLTLFPIGENGIGYKILNAQNNHEYYILENRQNTGWDTYIGRGNDQLKHHGMLVVHIDYSISRWSYNNINNTADHQCFTIIPADGDLYSYTAVKTNEDEKRWKQSTHADPFPGQLGVTCLFSNRQPVFSSVGTMHQPITHIVEHADGTITLTVCQFADVNGDGLADRQDVLTVYDYMLQQPAFEPHIPQDVNDDGGVDTQDVLQIFEKL